MRTLALAEPPFLPEQEFLWQGMCRADLNQQVDFAPPPHSRPFRQADGTEQEFTNNPLRPSFIILLPHGDFCFARAARRKEQLPHLYRARHSPKQYQNSSGLSGREQVRYDAFKECLGGCYKLQVQICVQGQVAWNCLPISSDGSFAYLPQSKGFGVLGPKDRCTLFHCILIWLRELTSSEDEVLEESEEEDTRHLPRGLRWQRQRCEATLHFVLLALRHSMPYNCFYSGCAREKNSVRKKKCSQAIRKVKGSFAVRCRAAHEGLKGAAVPREPTYCWADDINHRIAMYHD